MVSQKGMASPKKTIKYLSFTWSWMLFMCVGYEV